MSAPSERCARRAQADVGRARLWLAQHRLPPDEETLRLVAERLAARRVARRLDALLSVTFLAGYFVWLFSGAWRPAFAWVDVTIVMVVVMALFLLRALIGDRGDHAAAACLQGRVATLDRLSWSDLVGRWTVALLVGLTVSGWVLAAIAVPALEEDRRVLTVLMMVCAPVYCVTFLEVVRRRRTVARDEVSLVADQRLRLEEAVDAVKQGATLICTTSLVAVVGTTVTPFVVIPWAFCALASLTAWRHSTSWKRAGIPARAAPEVAR